MPTLSHHAIYRADSSLATSELSDQVIKEGKEISQEKEIDWDKRDENGKDANNNGASSNGPTEEARIYRLLSALIELFNMDKPLVPKLPSFEEFSEKIHTKDHTTITSFLAKHFGSSPVLSVLNLCNQAVVLSAIGNIRLSLLPFSINFKDHRGEASWKIFIKRKKYIETDGSEKRTAISVTHRRREQAFSQENVFIHNTFQFEWELEAELDNIESPDAVSSVAVRLLDLDWTTNFLANEPMTKSQQENEEKKFRDQLASLPFTPFSPFYRCELYWPYSVQASIFMSSRTMSGFS